MVLIVFPIEICPRQPDTVLAAFIIDGGAFNLVQHCQITLTLAQLV